MTQLEARPRVSSPARCSTRTGRPFIKLHTTKQLDGLRRRAASASPDDSVSPVAVTAILRAADVYPAIIRHPLNTFVAVAVAVTAIVRPCRGGQRDASAYAPRPPASTAPRPTIPIASPPVAGPITSARPSNPTWTSEPAWTGDSHSAGTGNGHSSGTAPPAHTSAAPPAHAGTMKPAHAGTTKMSAAHASTTTKTAMPRLR